MRRTRPQDGIAQDWRGRGGGSWTRIQLLETICFRDAVRPGASGYGAKRTAHLPGTDFFFAQPSRYHYFFCIQRAKKARFADHVSFFFNSRLREHQDTRARSPRTALRLRGLLAALSLTCPLRVFEEMRRRSSIRGSDAGRGHASGRTPSPSGVSLIRLPSMNRR